MANPPGARPCCALALLPQSLALIEVGASAGLTLLVDRYPHDYRDHRVTGTDPQAVMPDVATGYRDSGTSVLMWDGTQATACTDGHGASVE